MIGEEEEANQHCKFLVLLDIKVVSTEQWGIFDFPHVQKQEWMLYNKRRPIVLYNNPQL